MVAPLLAGAAELLVEALISRGTEAFADEAGKVTVQLNSSAIQAASYEPASQMMTITFNGGREYDFPGTDEGTFTGLVTASSPGSFYNEHIKGRFGGGTLRTVSSLTRGLMQHWGR